MSTAAPFARNEVIDTTKLRGPPPHITVIARGWFRLLFAPAAAPTPPWLRYADVFIHEAQGAASWAVDPRTPAWRHAELEEYAHMLVDAHNDVCASRTREAMAPPASSTATATTEPEPVVEVDVQVEVTGFHVLLLSPTLPDAPQDGEPPPVWLAAARVTLHGPDTYELDIPETTPTWLIERYRALVDDVYAWLGFTLTEVAAVIRTFCQGSPLLARLSFAFDVPDGYRRLVYTRFRTEGPQRDSSLLPTLSCLGTGLYRLDFPASHEVTTLTFDLVNETGTMSPDNPCLETLEYLEQYLLAMRTVFGNDTGEGEYAALAVTGPPPTGVPAQTRDMTLEDIEGKTLLSEEERGDDPVRILEPIDTETSLLVDSPALMSPLASTLPPTTHIPPLDAISDETPPYASPAEPPAETPAAPAAMSNDPVPDIFPVDVDEVYGELRSRVLDIYKRTPPHQDQLVDLQERHFELLRASMTIDRILTSAEGHHVVAALESRLENMVQPLRRWYALMQLNLPLWGQDLPVLAERMAQVPEDLQREEFMGAEFEFDDEEQCAVCLEAILPLDAVAITPCYHLMHRDCLENWFDSGTGVESCPVCHRDMVVYESLLAITKWPLFEVAWRTWMGTLDELHDAIEEEQ